MKPVVIEDILKFKFLENLMANKEGTHYAYQVACADKENNSYKRDIWAFKDKKPFKLTSTINASILCWENEDELLIRRVVDKKEKGTKVYKISLNGGEAALYMDLPIQISSLKKADKDTYIAIAEIDEDDPDFYLLSPDKKAKKLEEKKKNRESDYTEVTEVPYWFNGAGFTNKKRNALFLIEKTAKKDENDVNIFKLKRLTEKDFSVFSFEINYDNVYFVGNKIKPVTDFYYDLYKYDIKADKISPVYDKHDMGIADFCVKNGKVFIFATDYKTYGVNESPFLYEVVKGKLNKIEGYKPSYSLYESIVGDTMLGGGKQSVIKEEGDDFILYSLATVEDHVEIHKFDLLNNAKRTTVVNLPGAIYYLDILNNDLIFAHSTKNHLTELYKVKPDVEDGDEASIKKITSHNDKILKNKYIAEPKRIDYKSEGVNLHGWVLLPENFDKNKKYPAVLDIHGGPRGTYSEIFVHEMQVWASEGFIVMFTNIRGSDGRGDDFADIRGDYGGVDYQNLMDFVDIVEKKYPCINKKKICETGGSYGGFMTNWIVTHTDRFVCAASQRSIANWISMAYISDIGPYFGPDQCGINVGEWFKSVHHDELWNHSPLKYVDNAKTPTLFIHSDEDYRCPLPEGMQMMQAMTLRGIDCKMVIFHGENHELSRSGKPLHRIKRLTEITNWFKKHI